MKKNVLITGASTGLGRSVALSLSASGWRVFAGIRKVADGKALTAAAEGELVPVRLDVALEQSLQRRQGVGAGNAEVLGRKGRVVNVGRKGPEALFVGRDLAGQTHAEVGAAMEAAAEGDHARPAGRCPGDFDGVLHGLGPGGNEDRPGVFDWRDGAQLFGKLYRGRVRSHHDAGMTEGVQLLVQRSDHGRVAVPGVDHGYAGAKVDVSLALHVPEFRVAGARREHRKQVAHAAGERL